MECAVKQNDDMELVAVFTRRDPSTVKTLTDVKVYNADQLLSMQDKIDVLVLCGGSATDLPKQTAEYAKYFNVVDSFDTHAKIPEHFAQVDAAAKEGGKVAMISVGWDPGMFSLNRLYANAILRDGSDYTFWGKGVSQGHSDAIRRIPGVKDAKQYTIPVEAALEAVRNCENPVLTTRQKHTRECFVVAEEGADKAQIEEQIKTMPNYFADYAMKPEFLSNESILDQIREKDRFIHVPYHSFNGYIRVLREAAIKPDVYKRQTSMRLMRFLGIQSAEPMKYLGLPPLAKIRMRLCSR